MKSLLVKLVLGVVLFAGTLVGALAATGRLNHAGTVNIPLLGSFFPAPPEEPPTAGEAADAAHSGEPGAPTDAAHGGDPQEPKVERRPQRVGPSLLEPEKPKDPHGAPAESHGDKPADGKAEDKGHGAAPPTKEPAKPPHDAHPAEEDLKRISDRLLEDPKNKYSPGKLFRFEGLPAGLTPEQINEAWQRVQGLLADIDRRKTALDLREQELHDLADDISRRQKELGDQRTAIADEHRRLDQRIQKFQEQVKLVRSDEVAALKRNAETLGDFEPTKAAELVQDQWKTDRGQDEVLKLFEFMEKDKLNAILAELPTPMVQDLLKKRLRVSKEAVPSTPGK